MYAKRLLAIFKADVIGADGFYESFIILFVAALGNMPEMYAVAVAFATAVLRRSDAFSVIFKNSARTTLIKAI